MEKVILDTMAALQAAQPLDKLQSLVIFPNGTALAVFEQANVTFSSLRDIELITNYVTDLRSV